MIHEPPRRILGLQDCLGESTAVDTWLFSDTFNRLHPMDTNLITQRAGTYASTRSAGGRSTSGTDGRAGRAPKPAAVSSEDLSRFEWEGGLLGRVGVLVLVPVRVPGVARPVPDRP